MSLMDDALMLGVASGASLQALRFGIRLVREALLVVSCPCCRTQYTRASFMLLDLVGYLGFPSVGSFELRNCPCGNTLSRSLT